MLYLTDDLSLLLGMEEMRVLSISRVSVAQVKRFLRGREWENCVSNKFTAKRLSKLLNRKIEPCPMERYINRNKATIIFFPQVDKFKDFLPMLSFEMSAKQYRHPKFAVIQLVPTVHMNNYEDNFLYLFINE